MRELRGRSGLRAALDVGRQQPVGPVHHSPVILVCRSAQRADLIVAAVVITPRPGKAMLAALSQEMFKEVHSFALTGRSADAEVCPAANHSLHRRPPECTHQSQDAGLRSAERFHARKLTELLNEVARKSISLLCLCFRITNVVLKRRLPGPSLFQSDERKKFLSAGRRANEAWFPNSRLQA